MYSILTESIRKVKKKVSFSLTRYTLSVKIKGMDICKKCRKPYAGKYKGCCDKCAAIEYARDTELIRIHERATTDPNIPYYEPDPDDEPDEELEA